jgi:hypothetical protein
VFYIIKKLSNILFSEDILLGVGIPFTYQCLKSGGSIKVSIKKKIILFVACFIFCSLIIYHLQQDTKQFSARHVGTIHGH